MRILLSTIGSRGDVQPLVALGLRLKELGQEVRMCVPPDFRDWIEGLPTPTTDSLTGALQQALQPGVTTHAQTIATLVRTPKGRGTLVAAQSLINAA